MRILGIHHVAFAHADGATTQRAFEGLLGLSCAHTEIAPGFVERMLPVGDAFVQLLEADGHDGIIGRFVDTRGPALHHIAFTVDDIDAAVTELVAAGVRVIDDPPRTGGMGTRISFVHPQAFGGLLVELVESNDA